jgi:dUTP pyrophosphatase
MNYFKHYYPTYKMFSVALINTIDQNFIPTQASIGSAGYVIKSRVATTLVPGIKQLVPVGIALKIPGDQYSRIASLSTLANNSIGILGDVIDSTDQDEIQINLINFGNEDFPINVGDNIAQLIFERITIPQLNVVDYDTLTS